MPNNVAQELSQFGEPRLVCRTSRRTLVGGFVMAAVLCISGAAVLIFVFKVRAANWTKDIPGTVIMLTVAAGLLFAGWVVGKKINQRRQILVAVYDGGFSYENGVDCVTRRWDQIENIRWKVADFYEDLALAVGPFNVRVPSKAMREYSHTSYGLTVKCRDGVRLVFNDELENVTELARIIAESVQRNRSESTLK
jgi:hypothetical protein